MDELIESNGHLKELYDVLDEYCKIRPMKRRVRPMRKTKKQRKTSYWEIDNGMGFSLLND
jgi:hypothetical protein